MGFLPSELPQVDGWEIAAYFKSAREVAGDFYDAFTLPNGNLVCVIGDVCGKGVGAALFMTLFRSLIRATSTTDYFSNRKDMLSLTPSERLLHVISFTNNYVAETHGDANMFATVFIGLVNLQDGRLSYINCGNEPALLLRHGVVADSLRPTGPVIGVIPDAKFSVKEISMESRDLLLVFTDGIPDALNVDNVSFGNERLLKLLGGNETSPVRILKTIEEELHQFIGTADQFDDLSLLALKRNA
jgi:sigma-B regulation protein RsbU (phosphoserine phosphatase)